MLPGKLSLMNLSIVTQLYGFAINGVVLPELIKRCPIGIVYECTSSQSNTLKKSSYEISPSSFPKSKQDVCTSFFEQPSSTTFKSNLQISSFDNGKVSFCVSCLYNVVEFSFSVVIPNKYNSFVDNSNCKALTIFFLIIPIVSSPCSCVAEIISTGTLLS